MADGQWHLVERHIKVRQYGKVGESEVLADSTLMQKVSDGGTRKEATDSCESARERSRINKGHQTRLVFALKDYCLNHNHLYIVFELLPDMIFPFFVDVELFFGDSVEILTPKLTRSTS